MATAENNGPTLAELIDRFQSLQRDGDSYRKKLNDRNTVDIVGLLQRKGILTDLIIAADGQGYMTKAQLIAEISNEIDAAGGRLNIVDLPNLVGVDHLHVARAVEQLVNRGGYLTTYQILNGEILTNNYKMTLVREASSLLQHAGQFKMSEFSKKFLLPIDFVSDLLLASVRDGALEAVINEETVYTSSFIAAQRKKLLCALLGCSGLTSLPDLYVRHNILASVANALTLSVVEKELKGYGKVEGVNFVPAHLEIERNNRIKSTLMLNGFVSFSTLRAEGITNLKQYLDSSFNPCMASATSPTTEYDSQSLPKQKKRMAKEKRPKKSPDSRNDMGPNSDAIELATSSPSTEYPLAGHVLSNCFLSDSYFNSSVASELFDSLCKGDIVATNLADIVPSCTDMSHDASVIIECILRHFPLCRKTCEIIDNSEGDPHSVYFVNTDAVTSFFKSAKLWLLENRVTNRGVAQREVKRQLISLLQNGRAPAESFSSTKGVTNLSKSKIKRTLREGGTLAGLEVNEESQQICPEDAEAVATVLFENRKDVIDSMLKETSQSQRQREAMSVRDTKLAIENRCRNRWVELGFVRKALGGWLKDNCSEAALRVICGHSLDVIGMPIVADLILDVGLDRLELRGWCDAYIAVAEPRPGVDGTFLSVEMLREGVKLLPREMVSDYEKLVDAVDFRRMCEESTSDQQKGESSAFVGEFMNALSNACASGAVTLSCFHPLGKKADREAQSAWIQGAEERASRVTFSSDKQEINENKLEEFSDVVSYVLGRRHRCLVRPPIDMMKELVLSLGDDALAKVYNILTDRGYDSLSEEGLNARNMAVELCRSIIGDSTS